MATQATDGFAPGHLHYHHPHHNHHHTQDQLHHATASSSNTTPAAAQDTNAPRRRNFELFDPPMSLYDESVPDTDYTTPPHPAAAATTAADVPHHLDVPLIAELPADSTFPQATAPRQPRSLSPGYLNTTDDTQRISTYSQVQLPASYEDEEALLERDGYPTHPIKSMQGPFEESIADAIEPDHFDERDTMDAVTRRQQLLELENLSEEYSSRWRRRPGAKFHPLWKLIAQISFGIHLLHTQTAKSDEEVVRILQTHVDEVDGFLEDTSNDFALALKDIYERNRFLSVPLEHGRTFDKMLRDREFRTAIIEGNETIEHIVERTSQAMHYALQDIIQGIDATAELAKFLDRLVPQCVDNSEMIKIYAAMRGNAEGWWRCFCDLQVRSEKLTKLLSRLESILTEVNRRTGLASRRKLSKSSMSSSEHSHIAKQQRSSERQQSSSAGNSPVEGQQKSSHRRQSSSKSGSSRRHRTQNATSPVASRSADNMTSLAHKASMISFLEKPLPPDPLHASQASEKIRLLDPHRPIPRASRTRSQPPTPRGQRDSSIRESRSVENLAPQHPIAESIMTVPEDAEVDLSPSEQVMRLTAENLAPINQLFHTDHKLPSDVKSRAPTIPDRSAKRPPMPARANTYERPLSVYKYENPDAIKSSPNLQQRFGHKPNAPSSIYPDTEIGLGISRPRSAGGPESELLPLTYEMPSQKPRQDSVPTIGSSASLEEPEQNQQAVEKLQSSIRESSNIARLPSIPTLPSLESDDGSGSNTIDSAVDSAYASGGDSGLDDPLLGPKRSRKNKLASYYDVPDSIISLVAEGRQSIDMTALPKLPIDGLDVELVLEDTKSSVKQSRRPSLMAMKSLFASKRSPRTRQFGGGGLGGNIAMV